jgi:hypothetical protein
MEANSHILGWLRPLTYATLPDIFRYVGRYVPCWIHLYILRKPVKDNQQGQVPLATPDNGAHKISEDPLNRLRLDLTIMEANSRILGWLRPLIYATPPDILRYVVPDARPIKSLDIR